VTTEIDLSICIATFNRGRYIVETLDSIVAQMRPGVELLIVDGASTDDTSERMDQFRYRFPDVRYYREPHNSGVDQDFDKAVGYATGRYVWLMTDDDIMLDDAVSRVCTALEDRPDLLMVNSQVENADLTKVLNARSIGIDHDVDYACADDAFMIDMARGLTFIGSVIIKRDLWLARERARYYGSLFVHVGVIFQSPQIGRIRVLAEPLLRIRYGVAMWTPRSFEVWMYKWPDLIWSFDGYAESAKAAVTPREPWRRPMKLFHFRAKNAYSIDEYRRYFAQLRGWYRLCAFAISIFPATIANLLSIAYVGVRSTQNRIPLFDLVNAQRVLRLRRLLLRTFRL
jgi:abequosyltransferase